MGYTVPWVRIPPSPQDKKTPRDSGVFYFIVVLTTLIILLYCSLKTPLEMRKLLPLFLLVALFTACTKNNDPSKDHSSGQMTLLLNNSKEITFRIYGENLVVDWGDQQVEKF